MVAKNIASYKEFEEYALFEDGYVEDLKVQELNSNFAFAGKIRPTMITKTNNDGILYKLWTRDAYESLVDKPAPNYFGFLST